MEKGNTVGEQEKKEITFSNRDLRRLIVPLLIEQMLNCNVGLLDSLMVSTVGEAAVSAVSLVDCVNVLLLQVFAALAAGGAIVAGQYIGCRETKKACKAGFLYSRITPQNYDRQAPPMRRRRLFHRRRWQIHKWIHPFSHQETKAP